MEPVDDECPIRLCQAMVPVACHNCGTVGPGCRAGCAGGNPGCNREVARELAWQAYAQGEYVVSARMRT